MRSRALWAHSRHFMNVRPVYALGQWFLENLPIGVGYAMTRFVTEFAFRLSPKIKAAMEANTAQVLRQTQPKLSPAQIRRRSRSIAYKAFMNRGRWFVDQSLMASSRQLEGVFRFNFEGNWKAFTGYRDRGVGVILASAHVGNWHGGGVAVGKMGIPVRTVIYHNHAGDLMDRRVARRGNIGHIYVDGDPFTTMEIVRALRKGEVVAMLADRPWDSRWIEAPFFGLPAKFPVGPVRIARLAQVPIIPAFCIHERGLEFRATICDPIEVSQRADRDAAERDAVAELARVMERFIAPNLHLWFTFEPIWGEAP